ncbi:MAG: ATP-binding cassette domain-containing protein, partial [Nitrospinota bacterium]
RREILGVAGVAGNGQRELGEVLAGLRPATGGQVLVQGRDLTNASPAEIIRQGVSLIPEDRLEMGLVAEASVLDNLLLKSYRTPAMTRGPFLNYQAARQEAQQLLSTFQIDAPHLNLPVQALSGGNLQRLLLGRELSTHPVLLLAFHPTRGLDVAATEAVHRLLLRQREEGAAILLISEDLEEILTLADRIAVMYRGEVVGLVRPEETSGEELGFLMTGGQIPQDSPASEG